MVVGGKNQIKLTHLEKVDAKLTALDALKGFIINLITILRCAERRNVVSKSDVTRKRKLLEKVRKRGQDTR